MTKIAKLWMAVQHVRRARTLLREVGSELAADTMARGLKSVEGAHRNAIVKATKRLAFNQRICAVSGVSLAINE